MLFPDVQEKPEKRLVKWLSDANLIPQRSLNFAVMCNEHPGQTIAGWTGMFIERIRKEFENSESLDLIFNNNLEPRSLTFSRANVAEKTVNIQISTVMDLILQDLSIKTLRVTSAQVTLDISKCKIAKITTHPDVQAVINIKSTNIGTLEMYTGSIKHLEISHGSLLNFECPPPTAQNPFTGTVVFQKVFFPRTRHGFPLKGPQPYRNLRSHLRSLENAQMANLIHSAELAVEREDDTRINRLLSRLYQLLSDFGSSALRPLIWLLVLSVTSFLLVLVFNGANLTADTTNYVGWQILFLREDLAGEVSKALYIALQPIVNPLGVFAAKPLLVPRFAWLAVRLTFQGLFSVVLIALMIFAIRRRFKIAA